MRDQVLHYIRERQLLKAGDRVAVAVSGGADSVALLRVLIELRAELGIVLFVAHFNHQLRGEESDADERFVAELASEHNLPFFAGRADVRAHAAANKLSLEHAARELRYQWLTNLAREESLDAIATAHNSDDQAETVLMKFLRGAGTRGLAGIHAVHTGHGSRIIRPLLETPRREIESYLNALNQPWREDHTNLDTQHTRNRIRHELLPLLERDYNPNLRQLLNETAEISAEEEAEWEARAGQYVNRWHKDERRMLLEDQPGCVVWKFTRESVALQRRAMKCFLERHGIATGFQHVEAVRLCGRGGPSVVNLPGGWRAQRDGSWLELVPPSAATDEEAVRTYEYFLSVGGRCGIPEAGVELKLTIVVAKLAASEPPGSLLKLIGVGHPLLVRNWLPGDRFRPAHSASEEKLKRLFAEKRIPAEQRRLWPVALGGPQIVWVRGFPVAHDFAWTPGCDDALRIDVAPLNPPFGATYSPG